MPPDPAASTGPAEQMTTTLPAETRGKRSPIGSRHACRSVSAGKRRRNVDFLMVCDLGFSKPPPGTGTDLAVPAEPALRLGHRDGAVRANGERSTGARITAYPRATFEELRRATAGGVAEYAGVTWERVDAEDSVSDVLAGGPGGRAAAPRRNDFLPKRPDSRALPGRPS
jgi:hypothetical protein